MKKELNDKQFHVISAVAIVFSVFILIPLSFSGAAQWSPERELRKYIEKHYPWDDVEIHNVEVMDEVSEETPEAIIVERGPVGKAIFSFLFKPDRKVFVRADIRAFDWVVKSKRPYRRRHVIRSNDIYREKMDIRKIPGNAVKDPEKIIGKALRRSIVANIPLSEDMVEQSQTVKRGKIVMLIINRDGLRITTAGKIKEKGHVGSQVKAVNLSSNKEVLGVLVDEHTVNVLL